LKTPTSAKSSSRAAGAILLIRDREQLKEENRRMSEQLAAIDTKGPIHDPEDIEVDDATLPSDWILRGQRELEERRTATPVRLTGDSLLDKPTPAEQLLLDAIDVIRDRRSKYGSPRDHFKKTVGMINAAFADVLKRPLTPADWAVIMTLDKVARYMGPSKTADGPVDLAGYAACLFEVMGGGD
jgi:hypothetical protein